MTPDGNDIEFFTIDDVQQQEMEDEEEGDDAEQMYHHVDINENVNTATMKDVDQNTNNGVGVVTYQWYNIDDVDVANDTKVIKTNYF